jgi:hypothetical protein
MHRQGAGWGGIQGPASHNERYSSKTLQRSKSIIRHAGAREADPEKPDAPRKGHWARPRVSGVCTPRARPLKMSTIMSLP